MYVSGQFAINKSGGVVINNENCYFHRKFTNSSFVGRYVCNLNLSKLLLSNLNETLSPYILADGDFKPLPVSMIKPSGYNVQVSNKLS